MCRPLYVFTQCFLVTAILLLVSCKPRPDSDAQTKSEFTSQNSDSTHKTPPGLTKGETYDWHHLSEGAEFFPYEWMRRLPDAKAVDDDWKSGEYPLIVNGFTRYGVVREPNPAENPYLMDYWGMAAAWTDADPRGKDTDSPDVMKSSSPPPRVKSVRNFKGEMVPSIVVAGPNCAFCHNGQLKLNGKDVHVPGGSGNGDPASYYGSLIDGLFLVLTNNAIQKSFLDSIPVKKDKIYLKRLEDFTKETKKLQSLVAKVQAAQNAKHKYQWVYLKDLPSYLSLFKQMPVILKSLAKLTFELDHLPWGIDRRLNVLAGFMTGAPPGLQIEPGGFGRTDPAAAFANQHLRGKHPVPMTANVSFPPVFGIQYTYWLHNSAMTNAVVLRNIVQATGSGATAVVDDDGASSINLHNIDRLEKLTYRMKIPNFSELAGVPRSTVLTDDELNQSIAKGSCIRSEETESGVEICEGLKIYSKYCAGCHTPDRPGAADSKATYAYKLGDQKVVQTDRMFADSMFTPIVGGKKVSTELVAFASKIKKWYYQTYQVDDATIRNWEMTDVRGHETARDTILEPATKDHLYVARHLAGTWSMPPFLHNGSVPSIAALLEPVSKRPKKFAIGPQDYDSKLLGWKGDWIESQGPCAGNLRCLDTTRIGNSNAGHSGEIFGTALSPKEKDALLSFLKVLPPLPEYSWK